MSPAPGSERRANRRWTGADCAWLTGARLRHGFDVKVLDLSIGGARVESEARLMPGAVVELHLAAPGWTWCAGARVLRCEVSELLAEAGVHYRAALKFERPLHPPPLADTACSDYPSAPAQAGVREVSTQSGLEASRSVRRNPVQEPPGGLASGLVAQPARVRSRLRFVWRPAPGRLP
jgi:hypothetical protein